MQCGVVWVDSSMVSIELPSEATEVIPGVKWGSIDAFPSPAYWKYQVLARRIQGNQIRYRLGRTLAEEVGACLLGGHGIPASVGLAAYENIRNMGAFREHVPTELELHSWLAAPLAHEGRNIRYRFAKQKAKYLHAALTKLASELPPTHSGRALRDWLLEIPGIGHKTASWVARNWLDADDVAILDIHVLRAGHLGQFFTPGLSVDRHYLRLEAEFLKFCNGLGIRASELDAVMWHEMKSSSATIHRTLNCVADKRSPSAPRSKDRRANTDQLVLLV
jgi:thermostable 8-oxoguanine DNA glycosylase